MSRRKPPRCSCGTEYLWDWAQDVYVSPDGTEAKIGSVENPGTLRQVLLRYKLRRDKEDTWFPVAQVLSQVDLYRCHACNTLLGAAAITPGVGMIILKSVALPEWWDVDWEMFPFYRGSKKVEGR